MKLTISKLSEYEIIPVPMGYDFVRSLSATQGIVAEVIDSIVNAQILSMVAGHNGLSGINAHQAIA